MPGEAPGHPAPEQGGAVAEYLAACQRFAVVNQEVELDFDFRNKSINGTVTFYIFPMVNDLEEVAIDSRQCDIDLGNVTVDGLKTTATFSDPYDRMDIPQQWQLGAHQHHSIKSWMRPLLPEQRPDVPITVREKDGLGCVPADRSIKVSLRPESMAKDDARRPLKIKAGKAEANGKLPDEQPGVKISIPFRSKKIRDGLHFVGLDDGDMRYPHVYTRHSVEPGTASCIFPCIDDPSSRCMWKVSIKCPRTLGDAFEQRLATQPELNGLEGGSRKRKHGDDAPIQPRHELAEEDKLMEMTVICSGNLTGEQIDPLDEKKKIMTFECDNTAAHQIGFAIGPFEHIDLWSEFRTEEADEKLGANAAKIHGYCLPGRGDEVRIACQPVVAAADYFALEFGRYPFESYKICFVDDMVTDTVAVNSMSFCSSRLLYPEDIIEFEIENTRKLVHALASQYIGIHIVPNQRSDTWLVVGIQWFMADLFMKTICGTNWYKFHLKTLSDKLVEIDIGRPSIQDLGNHLHLGEFEMDFMSLKAPLVLFILDQRMSKFTGSTGVTRVVSQLVMKANTEVGPLITSITADDFRRICEKKSQYRTEEFWKQWVMGAGCPRLSVKQRFNKKNLNVDIAISQLQGSLLAKQPQSLTKEEFWREFQEEIHGVYAGEVQSLFTGPFTVRIHEADGTPYEHYLEIREDDKDGTNWSIAYNTKYKRLKRTKRRDGANQSSNPGNKDIADDDVVFFNSFGDVLTSGQDETDWGLRDWSPEMQNAMDQESYEWIRFDCNFEWLCDLSTDMPGYMYLAQLQQDKDVVAHQDAMLYLLRGSRHDMAATIETRTLFDRRYYHGIRAMAAQDLPKHATSDLNYIGLAQLILMYRHFFCDKVVTKNVETFPPSPNDFSDKAQYSIQCAIPAAIARTRERGRCSKRARNFLLDLLLFNDNSTNVYSDQVFISRLLEALTTSLIPETPDPDHILIDSLKIDDDDDLEFKRFLEKAIDEIDKYRRMDEWTLTYQNVWTTTVLDCKMRLMKARVIPISIIDFVQYLQDENLDLVRLKAFECLVELGMISRPVILKLLLTYMTTDSSPFVRDRLFKVFSRGIAAIALGDHKPAQQDAPPAAVEEDNDGLIIEQGDAIIEAKKRDAVRHTDITSSLAALKEELKGNAELKNEIWKAFNSDTIGLKEKQQIMELCSAMFGPEDEFLVTFNYPRRWKVERVPSPVSTKPASTSKKKQLWVQFSSFFKTAPKTKYIAPPEPEPPAPEIKPPEPKKIKISRPSISAASTNGGPSTPSPLVRQSSISLINSALVASPVATSAPPLPKVAADSISVQPVRPTSSATPVAATAAAAVATPALSIIVPTTPATASPSGEAKRPKLPKKRKSDDPAEGGRPKKPKTGPARKVVKLRFKAWDRLKPATLQAIRAQASTAKATSSTIVATPIQRNGPSFPDSSPAPGTPGSSSQSQAKTASVPGTTPAPKARKPLPSSTPSAAPAPATSTPNGTAALPAKPTLSRKITLKIKPKTPISVHRPPPSSNP
ncbi:hypothetical protein GQ53DRAFT_873563 [Thozetella sp. PMI_491]|nr:hypothetical protein GQ53DRAFT_873563 [Thozetella sp. PMI_491]